MHPSSFYFGTNCLEIYPFNKVKSKNNEQKVKKEMFHGKNKHVMILI